MLRKPNPAKGVQALDSLLRFFGENGEHWIRGRLDDGNGNHCLVGAIDDLYCKQAVPRGTRTGVGYYIGAVIGPHRLLSRSGLITFNDLCKNFDELRAVILKARALAQRDIEQPETLAADLQKKEAAAVRRRQLLAELERARMVCHAAGDTGPTYILCPRVPDPGTPERLAA
jgi:hypothetical protein